MDPLTHCLFATGVACAAEPDRRYRRAAALAGLAGGLVPDADVFLRSASDPLFTLEFHRHFTHSLAFSPVAGLAAAGIAAGLRGVFRSNPVPWRRLFLAGWLAVLSHIFCDAWTSYGTSVLWPFSGVRVALDWISIIDPALTVPVAACMALCLRYANRSAAVTGLCWIAAYLLFCNVQRARAGKALAGHFREHGIHADRQSLKPSFGNVIVWRGMAAAGNTFSVYAVRCPLFGGAQVLPGRRSGLFRSIEEAVAASGLPADSRQAGDIARFHHFSAGWIGWHPQDPDVIGDLRYAQLPDDVSPLWGIRLSRDFPSHHVRFETFRSNARPSIARLFDIIRGESLHSRGALPETGPPP